MDEAATKEELRPVKKQLVSTCSLLLLVGSMLTLLCLKLIIK